MRKIETQTGGMTSFMTSLCYIFSKELQAFEKRLGSYVDQKWQSPEHDKHLAKSNLQRSSGELFEATPLQL
jgi:hypothetical protein